MRQPMLLGGRERDGGEERGSGHLGEVEKWALPRLVREDRTEDMKGRESPRAARPSHSDHLRLRKTG